MRTAISEANNNIAPIGMPMELRAQVIWEELGKVLGMSRDSHFVKVAINVAIEKLHY